MSDRLKVLPQYLLPKQLLTQLAGRIASAPAGAFTTRLIKWFIDRYNVDMSEAANPDPESYQTFNDFFTRALKPSARPMAKAPWICPVDGTISQCGPIEGDQIFQAKGHTYSTLTLLGGDEQLARQFQHGQFATLYLSPKDYHRIHMPAKGQLKQMIHVPGSLFSVNPTTARGVPGLFARNERLVCLFEGQHGPFAMVLVGATIVGSMATVWHGVVNAERPSTIRSWTYEKSPIVLEQGQEMGRFLLGSTVVMLMPTNTIVFPESWKAEKPIRLGEVMGR